MPGLLLLDISSQSSILPIPELLGVVVVFAQTRCGSSLCFQTFTSVLRSMPFPSFSSPRQQPPLVACAQRSLPSSLLLTPHPLYSGNFTVCTPNSCGHLGKTDKKLVNTQVRQLKIQTGIVKEINQLAACTDKVSGHLCGGLT